MRLARSWRISTKNGLDALPNCIRDVIAQVTAYVVLQNPSAASGVSGFDFMLCNSGGGGFGPPPGCFLSTMTLPPGALNTSGHPQYTVGIATPLPQEPCVLLLTMNLLIFCSDCWCFGVQGIPFGLPPWYMTYFDANMLEYILSPCTGPTWDSCTMACINCEWCPPDPPIGTTSTTWGELKALYD